MITEHRQPLADTRGRFVHEIEWTGPRYPAPVRVAIRFLATAFCVGSWIAFLVVVGICVR